MTVERDLELEAAVRAAVRRRLRVLAWRYKGLAGGVVALVALVVVAPSTAPALAHFSPLGTAFGDTAPAAGTAAAPPAAGAPAAVVPLEPGTPRTATGSVPYASASVEPPPVPAAPAPTSCPSPQPSPSAVPDPVASTLPLPLPTVTALPLPAPSASSSPNEPGCAVAEPSGGDVVAAPGWMRVLHWLTAHMDDRP